MNAELNKSFRIKFDDSSVSLFKIEHTDKPILKIPRSSFQKHFRRVRERAKVFDAIPHGLRHSFTSHLVESGLDLGRVQRITGHQDIKTLQKYLHSTGSDLVPFRNAVQFTVPSECPEVTPKRTKWGEVRVYGQSENAEFQRVMKSRIFTKVVLMGQSSNILSR